MDLNQQRVMETGQSATAQSLFLEYLRALGSELAGLRDDVRRLTTRTGNIETDIDHRHGVVAEQSVRIDDVWLKD